MADALHNTITSETPKARPLSLQLLDIHDAANSVRNLIVAIELASSGLNVARERNAMAEVLDVVMSRMDDLLGDIETARETLS